MQKNTNPVSGINFSDIFDINDIQRIQDLFADATGVASIITHPDGTPITQPSNFCRLCNEIIRKTDIGLTNCFKSDAEIGKPNPSGPVIRKCLSGGLWDAGASIVVDGKHIANWLIGQVSNEEMDNEKMLQYAKEIGANQEDFMNALREVPVMSKERFEKVAQMLFAFATEISSKAYQNRQLTQSMLERQNTEDAFRKLILRQEAILAAVPEIIMEVDTNKIYTWANRQGLEFFGNDVIGKEASYYFEGEQETYRAVKPLFDGTDDIFYLESWQRRFDGKKRLLAWWCQVLKDNDGNVKGALSSARDITESKLAEEILHKEQYLMRNLMDNLPDHIYFKDLESRFIRVNSTMVKMFDLTDPDKLVGKSDFDFFTEEHAKQAFDDEQNIIRTGEPLIKEERETWTDRPDTWVFTTKVPLRDNDGRIVGTFGISRDITNRKKIEEELAAERNLLRTLIDNMPDRIYAKDIKGRFIICNDAVVKRMGMARIEDIIGRTDFDFVQHDLAAQYFENEQVIIRTGIPKINHEESMGSISGITRWNLSTKVPLRDAKGNIIGIVGMGRDITERKLAEEEIELKNELLQTINAEKDKFFSILAHDLKGPLSAFLDATQILAEEIQNMTLEEIKDITINMKESASNIYGLLENLLEWSRLKRGRMEFNPEKINVKQKITACIEVLKESARKKDIKITYSLQDDVVINADLHMFETIVRNLVSNAIKFTPKSGEIFVSATSRPDMTTVVAIHDTGIGMTKELISRLFLLNEKTNRKGTDGEPSTGLGLLLCKEFCEKHGGKIWVESEVGKGSTFSFMIPEVNR
jgi:PAS domain S-box-containing protein